MTIKKISITVFLLAISLLVIVFISNNHQTITMNLEPFIYSTNYSKINLPFSIWLLIIFTIGTIVGNIATWSRFIMKNKIIKDLKAQNEYLQNQLEQQIAQKTQLQSKIITLNENVN